jgi:hypothetical protein
MINITLKFQEKNICQKVYIFATCFCWERLFKKKKIKVVTNKLIKKINTFRKMSYFPLLVFAQINKLCGYVQYKMKVVLLMSQQI